MPQAEGISGIQVMAEGRGWHLLESAWLDPDSISGDGGICFTEGRNWKRAGSGNELIRY